MAKKSRLRKTLKIIGGVIVFFTLPTLLLFGFMYFKYNEDLPTGEQGVAADQLATKMLNALNEEAYLNTDYIEWTFKNRHKYKWYKSKNTCEVSWESFTVILDLENQQQTENQKNALLVTYTSGGSTPGDSYLWHLDQDGKPKSFQMWVEILPIEGLEATWENWTTTESGAQFPTFHKLLVLGIELDDVVGLAL